MWLKTSSSKTGESLVHQDHFWTPPDPKKGQKIYMIRENIICFFSGQDPAQLMLCFVSHLAIEFSRQPALLLPCVEHLSCHWLRLALLIIATCLMSRGVERHHSALFQPRMDSRDGCRDMLYFFIFPLNMFCIFSPSMRLSEVNGVGK